MFLGVTGYNHESSVALVDSNGVLIDFCREESISRIKGDKSFPRRSINKILDFQLENKLYALKEGNTNHVYHGSQFFDKNPNCSAFTSGILLFNNNIIIKDLFSQILLHIHNHITSMLPIPVCLTQSFIVYHAVKNNLYDNQKLINI